MNNIYSHSFTQRSLNEISYKAKPKLPILNRISNLLVISGASGEVGGYVIEDALKGNQFDAVVAITSQKGLEKFNRIKAHHPKLFFANRCIGHLNSQLLELFPNGAERVNLIHTIGGTPKGMVQLYTQDDLQKINEIPAKIFIDEIGKFAVNGKSNSIRILNISSLAVTMMNGKDHCLYANSRLATEILINNQIENLQKNHGIHTKCGSLRIGFVMPTPRLDPLTGGNIFDTGYEGSLNTQAHLPFALGLGNGKHPTQPIYIRDLTEVAIKALDHPDLKENGFVIDGVTKNNSYPFLNFISALHPKLRKEGQLSAILLPYEIASICTEFMSVGHLQPYAINYLKEQEERMNRGETGECLPGLFEQILGREGTDYLVDFKQDGAFDTIVCVKPKYFRLIMNALKNFYDTPHVGIKLGQAIYHHTQKIKVVQIINE